MPRMLIFAVQIPVTPTWEWGG